MFHFLAYSTAIIFSIIGAIVAWKISNFYISKRDFYTKSSYEILFRKIFWILSIMISIFLITLSIFGYLKEKFI